MLSSSLVFFLFLRKASMSVLGDHIALAHLGRLQLSLADVVPHGLDVHPQALGHVAVFM